MTPKGYFINSKNDSNVILIKDKDGSERPLNQKELEKFHQTQIIQSILNDIQNNN